MKRVTAIAALISVVLALGACAGPGYSAAPSYVGEYPNYYGYPYGYGYPYYYYPGPIIHRHRDHDFDRGDHHAPPPANAPVHHAARPER